MAAMTGAATPKPGKLDFFGTFVQIKIQNLNSQVITSQVLAKPWAVDIPMKNTMNLGNYTYHDSLHKDKSAGGLVASVNKNFTRFVSSAHIHDRMSEMTDHMVPVQDDM